MRREGLTSLFPISDTAIMGFAMLPKRTGTLFRRIRETAAAVIAAQPDVLVIIDSPDFTHRVAKRVRRQAPGIPIIDYVSPSVWAWRPGRARAMRAYVDHVLCLLPFEPAAHQRLGGPPCTYVGHPLIERLDDLRPDANNAQRRDEPPLLLVMPGSRSVELDHMLAIFARAVERIADKIDPLEVAVLTVPSLAPRLSSEIAHWKVAARVISEPSEKNEAIRAARVALVKSGTGTLEIALAGVPMVTGYRMTALETMLYRLLSNLSSVILANLVIGENVVPEFLHGAMSADNLARTAVPLFTDTAERRRQTQAFARLDAIMEIGKTAPSDRAAEIVLRAVAQKS